MESRAFTGAAYAPLLPPATDAEAQQGHRSRRRRACVAVLTASAVVALGLVVVAAFLTGVRIDPTDGGVNTDDDAAGGFPWSNEMLQWQRAGFHFQPEKNFMSDPNGPVYYRGYYHLFYQYNPRGVAWDNGMEWGHVVSKDMVHWRHLPLAMLPDHWYDIKGVLSGSITPLHNGSLIMMYTGVTNATTEVEVQCLAVPADPNDPLLRKWTKHPANPVLSHPLGIKNMDFRDPTTAWFDESDATWRTLIGSKDDHHGSHAGIAFMFKTKDFLSFERVPGIVHRVETTGMWECIDFYPVGDPLKEVLHVIKASMDDERHDYYSLGRYNATANTWTPLDPELDLGIGLRYDWGKLYASTSFYDPAKQRRIMLGYVGETDSAWSDVAKGWASLQSIPRTVTLDEKTRTNLLLWPVEEIEALRYNSTDLSGITLDAGSIVHIPLRQATQLDIEASFRLDASDIAAITEADVGYNCSSSGGAAARGALGPFGLLVHAAGDYLRGEQTAVYFYVSRALDGSLRTSFCNDESRSSRARDLVKRVVGSVVPVLGGEALSVRVLVDHSIIQSFAMGGRSTATSRVYPTEAIYSAAGVYLFNNATGAGVTAERLVVHEMNSALYNEKDLAEDL